MQRPCCCGLSTRCSCWRWLAGWCGAGGGHCKPAVAAELTDPKRTNRKANPSPVGRSAAKAVAVSWPRIGAMAAVMLGGAATLCLPWSIRGAAAIHRFNTTTSGAIDFAHIRPPNAPADFPAVSWTLDAQEAMKSLPAFVQVSNSNILTSLVAMSGRTVVTLEDVRHLYLEYFHCLPEPVRPWALLSIKGPLDFALANHPDAAGTYSKSALALPGVSNPMINLSNPDHLYLLNHGYSAGWQFISSDYGRWTLNLGRKLAYFSDGMTLGYTAANLPLGPFGQRRSIDLMTPLPDQRVVWRVFLLAIFLAGAIKAIRGAPRRIVVVDHCRKNPRHPGVLRICAACGVHLPGIRVVYGVAFGFGGAMDGCPIGCHSAGGLDSCRDHRRGSARCGRCDLFQSAIGVGRRADRVTPQWGPTAFECSDPIVIKPAPRAK